MTSRNNPSTKASPPHAKTQLAIGVSACLLGNPVRYDGDHKRTPYITDILGQHAALIPVCPEVEMGLPVPREPIRLESHGETSSVRLIAPGSGIDRTEQMAAFCHRRLMELRDMNLCGYIFQARSPSCGMAQVKVFHPGTDAPELVGTGLFAAALIRAFPLLPAIENDTLENAESRHHFLLQVFALHRLNQLFQDSWTPGKLVAFHGREKYLLMAYDIDTYHSLGKLVARASEIPGKEVEQHYRSVFMTGLRNAASRKKHTNVLQHLCGYFKKILNSDARAALTETVEEYRNGRAMLDVPMALLQTHINAHQVSYLASQTYLTPYPESLQVSASFFPGQQH